MTQLLIGTYHNLLHWDGTKITVVREGQHYGITWDHDFIYVSHNPPHVEESRIEIYDRNLTHCGNISMPVQQVRDAHQLYWHEGMLYITNTGRDRLETWDGCNIDNISWISWLLDVMHQAPATEERMHINSIWCSGELWYVCEHGYKWPPARVRIFDLEWNQVQLIELDHKVHDDFNVHNVYLDDDHMYLCRHRRIDVRDHTGQLLQRVYPHGDDDSTFLLRGMARTSEHFYIGESTYATRDSRAEHDSDVLILNDQLQIADSIFLPKCGQIYEIRVIDDVDYAHNGVLCPMVEGAHSVRN